MRRRTPLTVALVLALAGAAPGPAGAARSVTLAPPAGIAEFFGVNVNRLFNDAGSAVDIERQLSAVRTAGITVARTDAMWAFTDPWGPAAPGSPGFPAQADRRARMLAEHGLRWQPILDYTPTWAQSREGDMHSPPRDPRQFADFAERFAARYGPGGAFWAANRGLPYLPVEVYEIWNEENNAKFWSPAPAPGAYADLYLLARAAIHHVQPDAIVTIGGLANDGGDFLRSMYAARPSLAGQVDAVAIHPYATTADGVLASVDRFHEALRAVQPDDVPLYVTELGWYTSAGAHQPLLRSDTSRATVLTRALRGLLARRVSDNLRAVEPYTWWTPQRDPDSGEDWYGLCRTDGTLSPAGTVLASFARESSVAAARAGTSRTYMIGRGRRVLDDYR